MPCNGGGYYEDNSNIPKEEFDKVVRLLCSIMGIIDINETKGTELEIPKGAADSFKEAFEWYKTHQEKDRKRLKPEIDALKKKFSTEELKIIKNSL